MTILGLFVLVVAKLSRLVGEVGVLFVGVVLLSANQNFPSSSEGTTMLGTKMKAAALLLTPPTPEGRGPPSLRPKPNPKN